MKLIQVLQEASSLPISDLKKVIKKDSKASLVLNKSLKLDDIEDKESFLSSVKFYLFNNDKVQSFIKTRDNIKDIDHSAFKKFRAMRADDLTQDNLDWLVSMVADIFKEYAYVERGGLSADLKKLLRDWFNTSGRYYNLPQWAMTELASVPSIRPKKRIVLYRGLLFGENSLKKRKMYDGTLEIGNGLKFLQSIRDNKRITDLEWDRPSSWTTSKSVAQRFAKYGPANSQFTAMSQWLERSKDGNAIDGALGYVISIHAKPEDVLIDTASLNANFHMQHGDEGEVILKPGTYMARIVKKFTPAGEVDPSEVNDSNNMIVVKVINDAKESISDFKVPEELEELNSGLAFVDVDRLLYSPDKLQHMMMSSTTTHIKHIYDKMRDFFEKHLADLSKDDLRIDHFSANDELATRVDALHSIYKTFTAKVKHSKFKSPSSAQATGPHWQLGADEYRQSISSNGINALERALMTETRLTDRLGAHLLHQIGIMLRLGNSIPTSIHMLGRENQSKIISTIIDAFYDKFNITKSNDKMEAQRTFITLLKRADRNAKMLSMILNLRNKFDRVTKDA